MFLRTHTLDPDCSLSLSSTMPDPLSPFAVSLFDCLTARVANFRIPVVPRELPLPLGTRGHPSPAKGLFCHPHPQPPPPSPGPPGPPGPPVRCTSGHNSPGGSPTHRNRGSPTHSVTPVSPHPLESPFSGVGPRSHSEPADPPPPPPPPPLSPRASDPSQRPWRPAVTTFEAVKAPSFLQCASLFLLPFLRVA